MLLELNGKSYIVLGADFETFYGKGYTLSSSKLNTPEYIHDSRFRAHGAAIYTQDDEYGWVTHNKLQACFDAVPDWSQVAFLGHNTAFDGYILNHRFGKVPGLYLDTLSMSRFVYGTVVKHDLNSLALRCGQKGKVLKDNLVATRDVEVLSPELEEHLSLYAIDDIHDTVEAFKVLYNHVPDSELLLIDATIRMACDSKVYVDEATINAALSDAKVSKMASLLLSGQTIEIIMSNVKFADALSTLGVTPPMKVNSKGELTYAFSKTDEAFKALLEHPDEAVRTLVETRFLLKSTQAETRAQRFFDNGCNGRKLPMALNYASAKTNRWSGGWKLNVQNLKRKSILRRAIRTNDGYVLVVRDSAQIECRTLVVLARQQDMIDAFARRQDVYKLMASNVFHIPIEQITDTQRFIGKVLVLGLGYKMGAPKLQITLRLAMLGGDPVYITDAESIEYVNAYRTTNFMVEQLWKVCDKALRIMYNGGTMEYNSVTFKPDRIVLPSGNAIIYGKIHVDDETNRFYYLDAKDRKMFLHGGLVTENVIQGIARDIIAFQTVLVITQVLPKYEEASLVTLTHDEIVVRCREPDAEAVQNDLNEAMCTAPPWFPLIPLASDGGYAVNYSK